MATDLRAGGRQGVATDITSGGSRRSEAVAAGMLGIGFFAMAMASIVLSRLGVDVAMTFANDKQLLAELMRQI